MGAYIELSDLRGLGLYCPPTSPWFLDGTRTVPWVPGSDGIYQPVIACDNKLGTWVAKDAPCPPSYKLMGGANGTTVQQAVGVYGVNTCRWYDPATEGVPCRYPSWTPGMIGKVQEGDCVYAPAVVPPPLPSAWKAAPTPLAPTTPADFAAIAKFISLNTIMDHGARIEPDRVPAAWPAKRKAGTAGLPAPMAPSSEAPPVMPANRSSAATLLVAGAVGVGCLAALYAASRMA